MPSRPGPLALRLSPVERAQLEEAAAAAGVPLSTYIKQAALKLAGAIVISGPTATYIRELAALRGMSAEDLAPLLLTAVSADEQRSPSAARNVGRYPCGGYECTWSSVSGGMTLVDHYPPCPLAKP